MLSSCVLHFLFFDISAIKMSLCENVRNKVKYVYREYEFLTATCVMDVWERRMVNLTLVSSFSDSFLTELGHRRHHCS